MDQNVRWAKHIQASRDEHNTRKLRALGVTISLLPLLNAAALGAKAAAEAEKDPALFVVSPAAAASVCVCSRLRPRPLQATGEVNMPLQR